MIKYTISLSTPDIMKILPQKLLFFLWFDNTPHKKPTPNILMIPIPLVLVSDVQIFDNTKRYPSRLDGSRGSAFAWATCPPTSATTHCRNQSLTNSIERGGIRSAQAIPGNSRQCWPASPLFFVVGGSRFRHKSQLKACFIFFSGHPLHWLFWFSNIWIGVIGGGGVVCRFSVSSFFSLFTLNFFQGKLWPELMQRCFGMHDRCVSLSSCFWFSFYSLTSASWMKKCDKCWPGMPRTCL